MALIHKKGLNSFVCKMKWCIWLGTLLFLTIESNAVKIRYASKDDCDRFSLDAVYHERFKIITENIFKDSTEFVNRITDLVADSLTTTMAELPNRDASDSRERAVHAQFKGVRKAFASKTKKIQKKIASAWENLLVDYFDLMYDSDNASLSLHLKKALNVTEAYSEARKNLDSNMGSFISFIKSIVRDGLQGISIAADRALKEEASEKNSAKKDGDQVASLFQEDPKDKLEKKKLEITEMVVSGFLKNVTIEVIKQNIDLFKKVTIKPEDRDSVLDDILFDMLLVKNRMLAIIHPDIRKDKGSIDLARRSIYSYWGEQAEKMYGEKIKFKQNASPGSDLYYEKLWSDEKELMETLLNLMEVYP